MQKLLLFPVLIISMFCYAQKTSYSTEEIRRLGDLGRVWGAIHYFHPLMASGTVTTDSLALPSIRLLINDPSKEGFRRSVELMLKNLGDQKTYLLKNSKTQDARLFVSNKSSAKVHRLPGGRWYIALPTLALGMDEKVAALPGVMPDTWDSATAVIIDIRNANNEESWNHYAFLNDGLPVLEAALTGGRPVSQLPERSIYHNGFLSQTDGSRSIYSSGWFTVSKGDAAIVPGKKQVRKPFGIVFNADTHQDIVKRLVALRSAGLCTLIYEGDETFFPSGSNLNLNFADSLKLSLRISDFMTAGNKEVPAPDMVVDRVVDTSMASDFISRAFELVMAGNKATGKKIAILSPEYHQPKPGRYLNELYPSADKRLFALYNWWNAIRFFNPYMEAMANDWDSVLNRHIPLLLGAKDSVEYILAIRAMVAEINDSHGFVYSQGGPTPLSKLFGSWPPIKLAFIGEKLYVVNIGKDSSRNLSNIKMWDEVVTIDTKPVKEAMERFRTYVASSNEQTYKRDVASLLIAGPINSMVKLGLMRNGETLTEELQRTGRMSLSADSISFNDNHKAVEELDQEIGYVNFLKLKQTMVPGMFKTLAKSKAIIFDIRNYPQGTAWQVAPRLAKEKSKAVMFDKPYVNFNSLTEGSEEVSTLKSFFTVMPDKSAKVYDGKIVILCDQYTQSQAEYSIMMFQGATNVTVIGSQTAGADGNVTDVVFPGGYSAYFSGLGIYYPDGTPTQRQGIKIDIIAKPTIEGLKAGRDEVMDRAIRFINTGK